MAMPYAIALRRVWQSGLTLLAAVAALTALGWTWARVAHTLQHAHPPAHAGARPNAIVWGDRVFSERAAFARWLAERDHSYREWERLHPAGRAILRSANR
jgi:hypothetical protein